LVKGRFSLTRLFVESFPFGHQGLENIALVSGAQEFPVFNPDDYRAASGAQAANGVLFHGKHSGSGKLWRAIRPYRRALT
jgi:hypothetical protein